MNALPSYRGTLEANRQNLKRIIPHHRVISQFGTWCVVGGSRAKLSWWDYAAAVCLRSNCLQPIITRTV
jgi:hypothetical protein